MNILLTDIRSLTLEMQEIPEVAQRGGDSFTRLLQQQLPADIEDGEQVVEFKEYFPNWSGSTQTPELALDSPAVEAWQDYLSQQKVRITTDTDPVAATPVDVGAALLNQAQSVAVASGKTPTGTGEQLPLGGSSLPDDAIGGLAIPRSDSIARPLQGDFTIAAVGPVPVAAELSANPVQLVLTPAPVKTISAGIDLASSAPINSIPDGTQSVGTAPLSARIAGGQSLPDAGAAIKTAGDAEIANGKQVDAQVKLSSSATRITPTLADATADRAPNPGLLSDSRPDGLVVSANLTRDSVSKDLPLPREQWSSDPFSVRQAKVTGSALPREVPASLENVAVNGMPDATKTSAQLLRNHPEAVGPELVANRNLELPQQFATSQTQQAVTVLSAVGHSHATVSTATAPAGIQSALPAQLETMNLARSADAGEWSNGLSERVNWMINQKQNSAIIRLDPPMLGKLDVQVKIADDATTITIHTQHAQTRDLIETASVRLRELLQESGYQNVNVDVSQRQDQQQNRSQAALEEDPDNRESNQEQDNLQAHHQPASYFTGEGLLDTFA